MKILFVNFTTFWGGGEQWTYQVMTELNKRNHDIVLLSNNPSELRIKAENEKIATHAIRVQKFSFINPLFLFRTRKLISDIQPDIVFINSTFELKSVGFIIKRKKVRKIIYNRGIPKTLKVDFIKKYLFRHVVTDVIVNSNYVKRSLSNLSKYMQNEPNVVYHGIQGECDLKMCPDTKNIAIVGRLSHEKGIDYAIQIMQRVLKQVPDASLHIIGNGREMNSLKKLASELKIEKSIVFHGFSNNVEELLLQCSMLIMTSRWEGFGLVLLEAMKLKMPCIAFNHIAANEIIENNNTGFLIPDMNLDLFALKVVELLNDPARCADMGEKSYQLLNSKFTIDNSINNYEEIFSL